MTLLGLTTPAGLSQSGVDAFWMHHALGLAQQAADQGEVPVGALVVHEGVCVGAAANAPIALHDPTAHAEVLALREAGKTLKNYRLTGATLYVTLEPCPMCAGAMVHARIGRLVYGADDKNTGSAGSVFNLLQSDYLNHQLSSISQCCVVESAELLKAFFGARRV
jgi:tRNA(adenine34) deaminase